MVFENSWSPSFMPSSRRWINSCEGQRVLHSLHGWITYSMCRIRSLRCRLTDGRKRPLCIQKKLDGLSAVFVTVLPRSLNKIGVLTEEICSRIEIALSAPPAATGAGCIAVQSETLMSHWPGLRLSNSVQVGQAACIQTIQSCRKAVIQETLKSQLMRLDDRLSTGSVLCLISTKSSFFAMAW